MNQDLEQLFNRVRSWPAERQDTAARLLETLGDSQDERYRLTDLQIEEVRRRLADPDPNLLSVDEVKARLLPRDA